MEQTQEHLHRSWPRSSVFDPPRTLPLTQNQQAKRAQKPIIQIFAKVKYLCKQLYLAMTPGQDLWDMIAIVIALDSLHKDLNMTIASLLETGDKTIDQIQSILQSKDAKNLSKRAIGDTRDLTMAVRNKRPRRNARNNNKCYNCHKLRQFGRDCFLPNRRLNRTTQQSRREESPKRDSRREEQNRD